MKGVVTPILVWTLACSPVVFAACRSPRTVYLGAASVVTALGIGLWLASAGFGYAMTENLSNSLNGLVYMHKAGAAFQKGDLVAYRWHGGATYPPGTTFIKRVVGMPGDVVKRRGTGFWIGDQYIGDAKPSSRAGVPLAPAAPGVIADGEYFLANPSVDSLDSRYALSGNIKRADIIGKAYALF